MKPLTYAQALLIAFGVPETSVLFGHKMGKLESNRKKGPGRKHKQGKRS